MQRSKQKSNFCLAVYAETFYDCGTFLVNISWEQQEILLFLCLNFIHKISYYLYQLLVNVTKLDIYSLNESHDFSKMQRSKQRTNFCLAMFTETFYVCGNFLMNIVAWGELCINFVNKISILFIPILQN